MESQKGIKIDRTKIKAIREMPIPKTQKKLEDSLVGSITLEDSSKNDNFLRAAI